MKQYGQAEYVWYLIEQYIDNNMPMLTATQKEQLKRICREDVFRRYDSVRELEVA